ncbi:MAG: hypothetical protein WCT07_00815 [Candidatus Paceibacterota bacterium]|jgi:hypothetical protein
MPFSFKPTTSTETQEASPSQTSVTSTPQLATPSTPMSFGFRNTGEGRDLTETLLLGIFGIAILTLAFLFGYHYYLLSKVESGKVQIDSYEGKLDSLPLNDMRKLSNRLKAVNQLVKEHPSVNAAFRIIEESVENPVTYKRFDLHFSESLRTYELQLGAVAPNYRSIAEQMDTLRRKPYNTYIPSISIGDVHPDETGAVSFTLKMPIGIVDVLPEGLLLQSDIATQSMVSTSTEITPELQTANGAPQIPTTSTSTATSSMNKNP